MDIANLAQYFNDIVIEAHGKAVGVIKPEGSLVFIVQGQPTARSIDWTWRVLSRIPEKVTAGVALEVRPDPFGLGVEVILTVSVDEGEERLNSVHKIYWAKFVDAEVKYDSGKFKDDLLAEEIAFQLCRACEYLVMVAPKLGEVLTNEHRIAQEMKILNFTLHRA